MVNPFILNMAEHNENQLIVNNDSTRLPNKVIAWMVGLICTFLCYFIVNLNKNVEELLVKVIKVEARIEGYDALTKRVELLEIRMNTDNATKAYMYDNDLGQKQHK